jgi:hypothetical protein
LIFYSKNKNQREKNQESVKKAGYKNTDIKKNGFKPGVKNDTNKNQNQTSNKNQKKHKKYKPFCNNPRNCVKIHRHQIKSR